MSGQYVYVHVWDDDNANVYGTREAALEGIAANHDEYERGAVERALDDAVNAPGDVAYLDGGMSAVRYMLVTT